ncbi:Fibrinogen alpha/beta/gamma chain C-terminal globular domain [Trinorchestia longiramus]|nr:Fibrinogen alpha/beta/gamma chain C-terminal globular domain [Trinorchestia longiramus]
MAVISSELSENMVWCDLETDGGGWTVLQRRGSPSSGRDDFFKDWTDYKWGFGELQSDFWIGNEHIHQLTSSGDYELRIDLTDWSDEERWAVYQHFHLSDELNNYTLHIGDYQGSAGNSLKYHHGAPFSTRDRDNDINPMSHCARTFHGAWWFTACHESHLNGRYHRSPHRTYGDGINWMTFRGLNYSHKTSRMMVRPSSFSESQAAPSSATKTGSNEGRSALPTPPVV